MSNVMEALRTLAPGAEWSTDGTSITEWFSPDIPQPTQAEIDAEIVRLQEAQEAEAAQKAADKESANQKLRDLGLTDAEIEAFKT